MNIGLKYSWTNNQQLSGKNIYIEKKQSQRIGFSKLFFTTTHFFYQLTMGILLRFKFCLSHLGILMMLNPYISGEISASLYWG